jgi:hypothetical protein
MFIPKRAAPSSDPLTSVQKRAMKALLVGFSCIAGLVIVAMVQMTVDPTMDVYPEQTVASSTFLSP